MSHLSIFLISAMPNVFSTRGFYHTEKQTPLLTVAPKDIMLNGLVRNALECVRKTQDLERTRINTGRTRKLHAEPPKNT